MERVGPFAQQVPGATAHEDHVAPLRRALGRPLQAVQVFLMGRVQAEAIGHGDHFFVEPLQFGVRHVLDLGRLMEQFAVEQFPAEGLGEFPGDFAAAGTVFAGDGDDVHESRSFLPERTNLRGSGGRPKVLPAARNAIVLPGRKDLLVAVLPSRRGLE